MIEGSHFHSLDEYLKSLQLKREIKDQYTKEQVQRQGNLICGPFKSFKIFTSQPLSTVLHLAIWTQWFQTLRYFFFHESVEISLFTSLYNHPRELFPSPRGTQST